MDNKSVTQEHPQFIDLTKLDIDTLEAFFPSERPHENASKSADIETRRKVFFQIPAWVNCS